MKISIFIFLCSIVTICDAITFQVGPLRPYRTPSEVAPLVEDGDIIEIDAGIYSNDVAVWRKNNLTIRGTGGRAHIRTTSKHAEGKGIWVIKGNITLIENIEFSGAKVPDNNGAGIRLEGANLTIRKCYFHDNQNGILAGNNHNSDITIEYTEFKHNGSGDGYTHNLYIGEIRNFTIQYSYSHDAVIGHQIKSRALNNFILYNRLMDKKNGTSSYIIDLPNGGNAFIIGNIIQQGKQTDNSTLVSYGMERPLHKENTLFIINNTFVNERHAGVFIRTAKDVRTVKIVNNLFINKGTLHVGEGELINNLKTRHPKFIDKSNYDYHLQAGSPAINKGIKIAPHNGFELMPTHQYKHNSNVQNRIKKDTIDLGAFEFTNKK